MVKKYPIVPMKSARWADLKLEIYAKRKNFLRKSVAEITKWPMDFTIPLKKQLAIADSNRIKIQDYFNGAYQKEEER